MEIRLDARPDPERSHGRGREASGILRVLVAPGARQEAMKVWQRERMPKGTKIACVKTKLGFNAEIAVPASYLDTAQGGPWQAARLNVAVNDFDAEGEGAQLWWKPDWRTDRSYAGSGTFVKQ